jgi:hypothetical protein
MTGAQLNAQTAAAGSAAVNPAGKSQDPLDRDTPQSSVVAFLEACHSRHYARAVKYLDLRKPPEKQRSAIDSKVHPYTWLMKFG